MHTLPQGQPRHCVDGRLAGTESAHSIRASRLVSLQQGTLAPPLPPNAKPNKSNELNYINTPIPARAHTDARFRSCHSSTRVTASPSYTSVNSPKKCAYTRDEKIEIHIIKIGRVRVPVCARVCVYAYIRVCTNLRESNGAVPAAAGGG